MKLKIGAREIEGKDSQAGVPKVSINGTKWDLTTDFNKTNGSPTLQFEKAGTNYYIREKFAMPIQWRLYEYDTQGKGSGYIYNLYLYNSKGQLIKNLGFMDINGTYSTVKGTFDTEQYDDIHKITIDWVRDTKSGGNAQAKLFMTDSNGVEKLVLDAWSADRGAFKASSRRTNTITVGGRDSLGRGWIMNKFEY